jgi:hypothetical protein
MEVVRLYRNRGRILRARNRKRKPNQTGLSVQYMICFMRVT